MAAAKQKPAFVDPGPPRETADLTRVGDRQKPLVRAGGSGQGMGAGASFPLPGTTDYPDGRIPAGACGPMAPSKVATSAGSGAAPLGETFAQAGADTDG